VGLYCPIPTLENLRLRGMKAGQVGGSSGILG
jgi:hypothetical protein